MQLFCSIVWRALRSIPDSQQDSRPWVPLHPGPWQGSPGPAPPALCGMPPQVSELRALRLWTGEELPSCSHLQCLQGRGSCHEDPACLLWLCHLSLFLPILLLTLLCSVTRKQTSALQSAPWKPGLRTLCDNTHLRFSSFFNFLNDFLFVLR